MQITTTILTPKYNNTTKQINNTKINSQDYHKGYFLYEPQLVAGLA